MSLISSVKKLIKPHINLMRIPYKYEKNCHKITIKNTAMIAGKSLPTRMPKGLIYKLFRIRKQMTLKLVSKYFIDINAQGLKSRK